MALLLADATATPARRPPIPRSPTCARSRRAIKRRDHDTGDMRDPEPLVALGPQDPILIVGDIGDGGRTFLRPGRFLRGITDGRPRLFVTHGIVSQGLGELRTVFDQGLTANLFDDTMADALTVPPPPAAEKESGR